MANDQLTKEQGELLIKLIDEYKEQLYNNKKLSETKFHAMQTALYGVKCIVRDLSGVPRIKETAWVK